MTEILVQPNVLGGRLVSPTGPAKFSVMPKRGPYGQKPKQPPKTPEEIGHFLKEYRLYFGQTQEEVAERAEVTIGFLSEIERGNEQPSMDSLARIAAALGPNGIPRGMLTDVDPRVDPPVWAMYLKGTTAQQRELSRAAVAIAARKKR